MTGTILKAVARKRIQTKEKVLSPIAKKVSKMIVSPTEKEISAPPIIAKLIIITITPAVRIAVSIKTMINLFNSIFQIGVSV